MAAVVSTNAPVSRASTRRRRHGASTHTPITGANTATSRPAIANARPSQLAGLVSPGRSSPTPLVRWTENTNVPTTELTPNEPKSQSAQEKTCDRLGVGAADPGALMVAHHTGRSPKDSG